MKNFHASFSADDHILREYYYGILNSSGQPYFEQLSFEQKEHLKTSLDYKNFKQDWLKKHPEDK